MNLDVTENKLPDLNDLQLEDKWILSKYNDVVKSVTENLDKFELGIALQTCTISFGRTSVTGISSL
mgnify:CR=1 FL=1